MSNQLYESLKPKLEELPEKPSYLGDLYGLKIMSTPYLPYTYHEVEKQAAPPQPEKGVQG